jgi:hypothetical protein
MPFLPTCGRLDGSNFPFKEHNARRRRWFWERACEHPDAALIALGRAFVAPATRADARWAAGPAAEEAASAMIAEADAPGLQIADVRAHTPAGLAAKQDEPPGRTLLVG